MDVHTQPREARFFSILNNNDSPSFAIRPRQLPTTHIKPLSPDSHSPSPSGLISSSASPSSSPPPSRRTRPDLVRQDPYTRASSFSSAASVPLLRLSSTSSMDSSPSPVTPAYSYNDNIMPSFEPLTRQDLLGYLPSPTTITPFLDQHLSIAPPMMPDHFSAKQFPSTLSAAQYPIIPSPITPGFHHIPTPAPRSSVPPLGAGPPPASPATPVKIQSKSAPHPSSGPTPGKKNKYPCPYAQAHNCSATFTTSGHAARHGKKHTGEKGVHCPICNKAFTRKDNMKQHERTHKAPNSGSNSDNSTPRRSKAAITRVAQKTRQAQQDDAILPDQSRRSSLIRSPLSEVTSLAPPATDTSLSTEGSLGINLYPDAQQMLMPIQSIPDDLPHSTLYPPLSEDVLNSQASILPLPHLGLDKAEDFLMAGSMQMLPILKRGYSDLDTLAQAAESFDPFYPPQNL